MRDPATLAVIPILTGPLQLLLALLPGILMTLGGALLALFKPSTAKQSLKVLWRLKAPLLLLLAVGFGLVQAVRAMLPKPTITGAEVTTREWPLFRGGPRRGGSVPGSPAPLAGSVNWAFKSEIKTFYSSPAVVGNRLYVTGADKGVFSDRGAVYCLDTDTGGLVWKSAPDGFRATFSSPSVSGRFLVVGEGLHYTHDSRVFCLDVMQQGKVLWDYRTTSHVESTACIANGRAYIGAGDDGYYCFALEPDANGQARVLWHAKHDRCADAETAPVFHDGKIFVGLGLGGNALLCLDAQTGQERWRVPTPYPVFTPPTVWSNQLFFGMGNGNFIESAAQAAGKELDRLKAAGATQAQLAEATDRLKAAGEVWCLDLAKADAAAQALSQDSPPVLSTNDTLWRLKTSEIILGAIAAADDGIMYFGTRGGEFFALSAQGRELARRQMQFPILASPAIAGNHVYVVTENGGLFALERHTLELAWNTSLGTTGPFLSSPTIARGHVYVGSPEDGLLCVGNPADSVQELVWAGALGGPGRPGQIDNSPLPESGVLLWRWPPLGDDGTQSSTSLCVTAPAAVIGEIIAIPVAAGPRCGLLALTNNSTAPPTAAERWFYATTNGVFQSPALSRTPAGSLVFFVDGKIGNADRHLHCLDARNGALLWRASVAVDASGEFVVLDQSLLIQRRGRELACFDFAGRPRWEKPFGTLRGVASGGNDIAVIALASAPRLLTLDLPSGGELWHIEMGATTSPVVDCGTIFVGTTNGIAARRLTDGAPLWQTTTATPAQPLLLAGSTLATITCSNELMLFDSQSGRVQATIPGVLAAQPPLLTREAALFATKDSLMRLQFGQRRPQRWMSTAGLGELSAPLVMAESAVYFATPKGFLKTGRLK